jgi:hypothetical protein
MEKLRFLYGPCYDVISKGQIQFRVFFIGVCKNKTWTREAEEPPLLEAVAK